MIYRALLNLGFVLAALPFAAAEPWQGHWEGTASSEASNTPVVLDLEPESGSIGFPAMETLNIPLSMSHAAQGLLTFDWLGAKHTISMEISQDRLSGTWSSASGSGDRRLELTRTANSRPYTAEEITFQSDIQLAGTLYVPMTAGPHAGIALVHGSGDNERWWRAYYADFFARQGLAVVFFDKRGNGFSEGNWREAGFDELADDCIAALEFLSERDDIRRDALGLWGISQAGWIMPVAAARSDLVSFLIVTSGATVNVEEENYYDYLVQLRDSGYGEDVQNTMLEILRLDTQVTRTGEGYELLKEKVEPYRQKEWFKESGFLATPPNFVLRRFMRLIIDFEPRPYIEQLHIPVLWLYGEEDRSVETPRSIAILQDIQDTGDYDFTVVAFPGADHGINVPAAPDAIAPKRLAAPGYWDTIAAWLDTKGLSKPVE